MSKAREKRCQRLPLSLMEPVEWEVRCPGCATPEVVDVEQEDSGAWVATGPTRFPVCEICDLQFEVAPMRVCAVPVAGEIADD